MKDNQDLPLPANVPAEMAILGAILLNNGHYQEAAGRIEAVDFSLDSHRRVFARMGELITAGAGVDNRNPGGAVTAPQAALGGGWSRLVGFADRGSAAAPVD